MEERNLIVILKVGRGKKESRVSNEKNSENCHVVLSVLGSQEAGKSRAPKVSGNVHMSFKRRCKLGV